MSDRMIPVPESARIPEEFRDDVERLEHRLRSSGLTECHAAASRLLAALPEPEPTFTDQEALAFYRAMYGRSYSTTVDIKYGRFVLSRLADVKWTAPKALCPPPSPELVEVVEAARAYVAKPATIARLLAAVAAYDEQEG